MSGTGPIELRTQGAIVALYFAASIVGQSLALPGTNASPVWPPAGVAIAAVWLLGPRVWPAILLASFMGNFLGPANASGFIVAAGTNAFAGAVGGTVEAALGGWLLRRWTDTEAPLERTRHVFLLAGLAPLFCLPSAIIGAASLGLHGFVDWAMVPTVWLTWWLGDVAGAITFAPLIITWWRFGLAVPRPGESALMLALLGLVGGGLFFEWLPGESLRSAAYLVFPILLWSSFRLAPTVIASGIALVSVLAVAATASGLGPFLQADLNASLLSVQSYVAVVAIATLSLATTMIERQGVQSELQAVNDGLDRAIAERTQALQAEIAVRQQYEVEQTALGVVRDAVWALSTSDELEHVLVVVRQALLDVGVPFRRSGINVIDNSTDPPKMRVSLFNATGELEVREVEDENDIALRIWQEQKVAYRRDLDSEDPFGERDRISRPTRCVLDIPFSHGTLAVASEKPDAFGDSIGFLERLAGVLSEGFRRAADLRLLEERALHLQREEHRQRTILETADEGFWRIDNDSVTAGVNQAMCNILGRTAEQIIGQPVEVFYDEDNLAILRAELKRRGEGATGAYEVSLLRPDGSLVPTLFNATPIHDEAGTKIGSFAMVTDVSERHEQERRRALLSSFREAVWQLDHNSAVSDVLQPLSDLIKNSGIAVRAYGVNIIESEAEGLVRAYTTGENAFRDLVLDPIHGFKIVEFWKQGQIVHREDLQKEDTRRELKDWDGVRPDGPRSIVDVPFSHGTLAANSPQAGAFTPHLGLLAEVAAILSEGFRRLDDLHALRDRTTHAEEAQRAAEAANRSKSVFLANMSHEIRTPMNAILGFTEILQGGVTDPRYQSHVASIQTSGKKLLSLINDILDLSKVESGKLELAYRPADIHAAVRDVERMLGSRATDKGIDLQVTIESSVPGVLVVDEVRVRQLLLNLVSNAVKFTEKGHVWVVAQATPPADNKVDLTLTVSDTGVGIPPDQVRLPALIEALHAQHEQWQNLVQTQTIHEVEAGHAVDDIYDGSYQELLQVVAEVLEVSHAHIFRPDDSGALAAVAALHDGVIQHELDGSSATGDPVETFADGKPRQQGAGASVPILYGDESIGVLSVDGLPEDEGIRKESVDVLWRLGREAALMLHSVDLSSDMESGDFDVSALLDVSED